VISRILLRLLFVSHSFPPPGRLLKNLGGMQRVATELHAALAAHPVVQLHSLLLETAWWSTHVRVVPFGLKLLWQIPRLVRREAIDAVLFSSMVTAALAVPLRGRVTAAGAAMFAIAHGRDVTLPVRPYQRYAPRIFAALDGVFPVSRATGEQCLQRGLPEARMRVIPNGIDVGRFARPLADPAAKRRDLADVGAGVPTPSERELVLCGVGRHVERKGFAWFAEHVMPRLPPEAVWWLAGEGPATPAVREAVERLGLQQRVRLLGRIPDEALARLYRGSDLFVMPNIPVPGDMEGFGVVMLEAGLSGTPVVAARLEGIQDVVREGENGHLVPSGDAAAFAERILAYHADRDALAAASRRAARFTADTFGWPTMADRYVRALREMAAERRT
jgi:phosphatidyl-myo-inositol dimannoside synthase